MRAQRICAAPAAPTREASPVNIHATATAGTAAAISPAEWEARVDLAAVYRLVAHHGWDDVIYNHCFHARTGGGAKVPDEAPRALMDRGHRLEPRQSRHARGP